MRTALATKSGAFSRVSETIGEERRWLLRWTAIGLLKWRWLFGGYLALSTFLLLVLTWAFSGHHWVA